MTPEELLKKADEALDEKGWCTGHLTHPRDGSHCSLGAIGYARWGEEWDRRVLGKESEYFRVFDSYERLMHDPLTAAACARLADEIRAFRGRTQDLHTLQVLIEGTVVSDVRAAEDINEIMTFNDGWRYQKGGKATVRKFFAKAAKVVKKITDHQPRVEYEPAVTGEGVVLEKVADL